VRPLAATAPSRALPSGHHALIDVAADLRSIAGAEVTAVVLDYRVSLQLIDPDQPLRLDAWLVLGVPFAFHYDKESHVVDAETAPTLEPCWRLLRRRIVTAEADDDLNLILSFDDGSAVSVKRDEHYEAWELHGKGVAGVLAGPR
jgi:hypothetical protein